LQGLQSLEGLPVKCSEGTQVLQRKLTAIMAADVVGYSRLMELDEAGTLVRLQANRREIVMPRIASHGGRVVKLMGDGSLIEFASVVSAVACAVEIQGAMAGTDTDQPADHCIRYRIGINLGDVMIEGDDIYGDGVNVAARLQEQAPTGGIALSASVKEHVSGKITLALDDLGELSLKNIERPVRVFTVRSGALANSTAPLSIDAAKPDVGKRVALCVLPFTNMSGDPEQDYFSDGITEDIITDLSKVASLFVVSRNTAFSFKGKSHNLAQIARQLNVKYVLEGSVRKAGGRVRITAQLIEGVTDGHVWAERYDRTLDDIFALQDEISAAIVSALKVKLLPEEKEAIERHGTNSTEAYQILLMARHYRHSGSDADVRVALRLAQRAVEIDPSYAEAWALIAASQISLHEGAGFEENGLAAAERALELDSKLATAHAAKGRVLCGLGRYDEALAAHAESLHLGPESFDAHYFYGRTCTELGRAELAVRHMEKAAALSETDYVALGLASQSYTALHRSEEARDAGRRAMTRIEKAIARRPDDTNALFFGAAKLAELGQADRAREWANRASLLAPDDGLGHYNLCCAFALLGEQERAVDFLERCFINQRPQLVVWAKNDSDLDSLRDHPRYRELIRRQEARLAGAESQSTSETGVQPSGV
jgi:adenylate cyclase